MPLRALPAMRRFLDEPEVAVYSARFGTTAVKAAVDDVLREARAAVARDAAGVPPFASLLASVRERLARESRDDLTAVLNATGVLLHTNLGRAPLAAEALDAIATIGRGYSNLEFDIDAGTRGSRYERVTPALCALTGAEDALVVNNCAAAMLLLLDTFARGAAREVIVSRNQLVEIGGGFRLPDVLARSGAALVEVGATNKVYLRDFERALSPRSALLLRSHTSNYRIEGFTADVAPADLAALGRRVGVTTAEDLGSGALVDLAPYGLPHERTVAEALADGFDVVAFSGDKLLGGPQAGILAGRAAPVARMRANPLLRALRVDKATLAALGATLHLYVEPARRERIPFFRMLGQSAEMLRARAQRAIAACADVPLSLAAVDTIAYAGGGAAPLAGLPSAGIAVRASGRSANALCARLRAARPPVIARADGDAAILDLRTVPEERDADIVAALRSLST